MLSVERAWRRKGIGQPGPYDTSLEALLTGLTISARKLVALAIDSMKEHGAHEVRHSSNHRGFFTEVFSF
jgi:hypothetical protein